MTALIEAAAQILGHNEFAIIDGKVGLNTFLPIDEEHPDPQRVFVSEEIQKQIEDLARQLETERIPEELKAAFAAAVQIHVDQIARERSYGDGSSIAGYFNSTVAKWKAEATVFIAWRDAVWIYVYAELAKAIAGEREIPTIEAFIGELPTITWPNTQLR